MTAPMMLFGQSYKKMWKLVEDAEEMDLPQQVIKHAEAIAQKAKKERQYGHLLKAQLVVMGTKSEVSTDSLVPAVRRMEAELQAAQDGALRAVYATVLNRIYSENNDMYRLVDSVYVKAAKYRDMALADPKLLARTKAATFDPMVKKGADSRYFNHDLLSLIGCTLERYDEMHAEYVRLGNRPAACLSALWKTQQNRPYSSRWRESPYIHQIDSLIQEYGDLDVCAELALERYDYMANRSSATRGDRLAYIHEAVTRWPKWPGMNRLRNAEQELTNPKFSVRMEHEMMRTISGQKVQLYDLRNISQLTMNVYRTDLDGTTPLDPDDDDDYPKIKKHLTLMPERTMTSTYNVNEERRTKNENESEKIYAPYEEFGDTMQLEQLPKGVYVLEWVATPSPLTPHHSPLILRRLLHVSDLYLMNEGMPDDKMRFVVVNSQTGQPVSGARLRFLDRERKTVKEAACDAKGEYLFNSKENRNIRRIYAFTDDDCAYDPTYIYGSFSYDEGRSERENTNIYTDRSIYRPGQTVHVAVLVYNTENYVENRALENRSVNIMLRDANYKVVAEKQVTTDKYGKASAEFVLPTGQLNGRYTIECNNERHAFRVEDYKRPTYEVTFDDVKTNYQPGDTLTVIGEARSYAGVGVQGAKVSYTVKRRVAFWWLNYSWYWDQGSFGYGYGDEEITSDEVETDVSGKFNVEVPLTLPEDVDPKRPMFYQFVIDAHVVDQAGESHDGFTAIPLGTRPQVLTCDLPEQLLKEEQKTLTFHLRNSAGNDIEGKTVRFRLDSGEWQETKTNTPLSPLSSFLSPLTSGKHTLEAICEGDTLEQTVTVFSLDDTKPCTETPEWFYTSASRFPNDGTPVTVQVGSSDENCHVVYCIIAEDKVLESGSFDQSNALWNRKFTYKEEYGNGLLLSFAWVKNDKLHEYQTTIERPVPDKKLTVRWETFRDRLTPGQKEEWKLVVTNPDGTPADAQVMATMYDKSLDQLYSHRWGFSPYIYLPHPNTIWNGSTWGYLQGYRRHDWDPLDVKKLKFSRFDTSGSYGLLGYNWDEDEEVVVVGYGVQKRSVARGLVAYDEAPMMMEAAPALNEVVVVSKATDAAAETDDNENDNENGGAGIQMRENLNETAFFYPMLTTDKDGRTVIKFTLPESLTTWRFMGIATTQDMKSGYIDGEAVAQKEVMVQPNMPRFLRMGDQGKISTRIFNTTNHSVSGTAMLRLLDPETNKVVLKLSQPFTVKAGETGIATFDIDPSLLTTHHSPLYICQISASGKNFSDGEQHYLPVLPNQERVTVTVPFTQHEPGTTSINIAKLFPTGTSQQKLTVEYTNNPAWLMVQALPSVGNPREENAIDQAAWLYSNLIAKTLVGQSDNIRQVFNRWKMESADDGSLTAQLAKNQELKDILLQETPWVNDADRETEQKQRLADFFDENLMGNRIDEAIKKLRALQKGDGSWSWWPGMDGSFYMTVSISEMLTRLNVMAGKQQATDLMLSNAFKFMGKEIVEDVKEMKKWEKEHGKDYGFPSFKALQYLYICALDGRKLPKDVQAANDYLIGKMKKDIKSQSIYEKALSAIILAKIGETKRSQEYAQSLKEYTVFTEEKGRYYDTQRAYYSWYDYKIPTEVMAIEALKVITPEDEQTVEEMLRWLLQEKRTQAWDTPINSVNAVYAFLFDNTKLLDAQEQSVLAIDGKPIELPKATAGIGYVKTAIDQPKGREFTAKKTSTGTSWGALYAQFMQPTRDIEQSASGIKIKREVLDANGQQLTTNTLKVGDRIKVRITIESERDLDFVQVLDRRAACMEPVNQLSGYRNGAYCSPKDNSTNYYLNMLPKGKRVIETEYYIDRAGQYETGTCTIQCAYSPEYRATAPSMVIKVKE